jgi:hypothetical protein
MPAHASRWTIIDRTRSSPLRPGTDVLGWDSHRVPAQQAMKLTASSHTIGPIDWSHLARLTGSGRRGRTEPSRRRADSGRKAEAGIRPSSHRQTGKTQRPKSGVPLARNRRTIHQRRQGRGEGIRFSSQA